MTNIELKIKKILKDNNIKLFKDFVENETSKDLLKHQVSKIICEDGDINFLKILFKKTKTYFFLEDYKPTELERSDHREARKAEEKLRKIHNPMNCLCKNNNIKMFSFLYKQKEFEKTKLKKFLLLKRAIQHSNIELVKFLIKDIKTFSDIERNALFIVASDQADVKCMKYLFYYFKTIPKEIVNDMFSMSLYSNDVNKTKYLINKLKIKTNDQNVALYIATINLNLEMITLLMKNKKVNPANIYNNSIVKAAQIKHYEILNKFLEHPDSHIFLKEFDKNLYEKVLLKNKINQF